MKFENLTQKYTRLVYKICLDMLSSPQDAEDITQEAFFTLYTHMDRYNNLNESEMKNLICKIALNKCKDFIKKKINKISEITVFEDISNYKDYVSDDDIYEEIIAKEKKETLTNVMDKLKEPYKTILYEYYINEYSLDELATKLNVAKPTLKVNIYRGKKLLKSLIEKSRGEILDE